MRLLFNMMFFALICFKHSLAMLAYKDTDFQRIQLQNMVDML